MSIVCSRFDNIIPNFDGTLAKYVPINFKSKNGKENNLIIVSISNEFVYDGNKYQGIYEYFYSLPARCNLLVLTDKEVEISASHANLANVKVFSFETCYPILNNIKYFSDLKKNIEFLAKSLRLVRSLGIRGESVHTEYKFSLQKRIRRKIFQKSNLDKFFAHAYLPPFQEVFVFSESRANRKVIALDFNSMFSSCMIGPFLEPKKIYYKDLNIEYDGSPIEPGLYRVVLKNPLDGFFRHFHPFRYTQLNKSSTFMMEDKQEIEVQLFNFELEYYYKFFSFCYIKSCFKSDDTISHPLAREALRLFSLRSKAKNNGKNQLERFYKLRLAMLHSITNPFRIKWQYFKEINEVKEFFNSEYSINESHYENYFNSQINNTKKFKVFPKNDCICVGSIDLEGSDQIFSLSSQVLAMSRLKICIEIENILKFEGVEICYINTDSIHISIPESSYDLFLEFYKEKLGNGLGQIKIQTTGSRGVWFDVGNYFIFENDSVVQFKRALVNHRGNTDPFIYNRCVVRRQKISDYFVVSKRFLNFKHSLSYGKILDLSSGEGLKDDRIIKFNRFSFEKIASFQTMLKSCNEEVLSSSRFKFNYFKSLRDIYSAANSCRI